MRPNNSYSVSRKNKAQRPKKGGIFCKILIWNGSKLTYVVTPIFGTSFGTFTFDEISSPPMHYKTLLIALIISVKGFSTGHIDTLDVAPNVDSVYAHYVEAQESEVFEGFTIQLFSGDRDNANKVRAKVVGLDLGEARVIYKAPNFKVHVGAFPTTLMAEQERQRWLQEFPDAFVVQTLVPLYPIEFPSAAAQDSLVAPEDSRE